MGATRRFVSVMVCLVALVAGACAEGDAPAEPDAAPSSEAPTDAAEGIAELCAPVADEYEKVLDAGSRRQAEDAAAALAQAEQDLAASLRELDGGAEVDAYADELVDYSKAQEAMGGGESMDAVVDAAKAGVRLERAAAAAELPDECPPPPSVDADNNLFVAKANRECFELVQEAGGEPFDAPRTPEEVALMIDLAQRLTARIGGAVRKAATPRVEGIPVEKIVRLNEKRFRAIDALAGTFDTGDYGVYRKAGRKLRKVSRKADRTMMSYGLVLCARAFSIVPL